MAERRQAFRREPIEVELGENQIISVAPVPWEVRNDIGNEIIKQHTEELNAAVQLYVTELDNLSIPQLQMRLANKLSDPIKILQMGLETEEFQKATSRKLYLNQITVLLVAILEINDLKHLESLVDPNSDAPDKIGGILTSILQLEPGAELQNQLSGQNSSSEVSPEKSSETSLIQNSENSSTEPTLSSGTTETGS